MLVGCRVDFAIGASLAVAEGVGVVLNVIGVRAGVAVPLVVIEGEWALSEVGVAFGAGRYLARKLLLGQ